MYQDETFFRCWLAVFTLTFGSLLAVGLVVLVRALL